MIFFSLKALFLCYLKAVVGFFFTEQKKNIHSLKYINQYISLSEWNERMNNYVVKRFCVYRRIGFKESCTEKTMYPFPFTLNGV